ncbi:hypothetical protein [Sulfurimonas sp.]|nr:hypothetical protein [Sulfurimonas sp.]
MSEKTTLIHTKVPGKHIANSASGLVRSSQGNQKTKAVSSNIKSDSKGK